MQSLNFSHAKLNLLSSTLISDRLQLLPISDRWLEDEYREFNDVVTTYMIPAPSRDGLTSLLNVQ